ncbi:hypothetical protein VXE41_20160, partial [Acinetobacter variabilis]
MTQKTILGLAAILALTLISIAGFYFFSPKHTTEKTVPASTSEVSSAQPLESASSEAVSTVIAAAEVDGIDV